MFGCDQRVKITCCKDAITETHARGRESKRQRKEAANNVAAIHLIYTGKNSFESLQTGIPPNPLKTTNWINWILSGVTYR